MNVKIKTVNNGIIPSFKRIGDAAADCYSNVNKWVWLFPTLIPLGFCMELPESTEAVVRPRSGLSSKAHYVSVGTIDSNYRGEVKANMWSLLPYKVKRGDRVAQIACRELPTVAFIATTELTDSNRGSAGFGSSGR